LLTETAEDMRRLLLLLGFVLTSLVAAAPVVAATTEPPNTTEAEIPPTTVETLPTTESTEAPTPTEPSTTTEAPVVSTDPPPTTETIEAPTASVPPSVATTTPDPVLTETPTTEAPSITERPETTVIPTADVAASLVVTEAIGPGRDPSGQYHWTTVCGYGPYVVLTNTNSPGDLTIYESGGSHTTVPPGQSGLLGYDIDHNPEDVTWSVGLGGFSQTPTIVDSGTFADCRGATAPVFVAGGYVGCDGRLIGLIEYRGPGSSVHVSISLSAGSGAAVPFYDSDLPNPYPGQLGFSYEGVLDPYGTNYLSGTATFAGGVTATQYPLRLSSNCQLPAPAAPQSLTATPGSGQVALTWLAPTSTGGNAITDYVIQRSPNGTTGWVTIDDGFNTATAYTVTGLTNGTRYYFRVLAMTRAIGPWSNVANAVPRTVPSAPRTLSATPTNVSGQLKLSWLLPTTNGGAAITDYIIQRSPNGTTGWVTINDGTSNTITFTETGLTNGTRYYYRVLAHNAAGNSTWSNIANNIPRTKPSAPRTLTATPTNVSGQVRLSWLLPASDGGSPITDYIIQRSANGTTGWSTVIDGVSTSTIYTATGLTNGTRYYFRVLAKNAAGSSASSNTANAIPRTPSAPRTLTAAATSVSGQVRLSWLLPATNGGLAITDYVIQRSPNGTTGWVTINDGVRTTTTYTVTGLTGGTRYYFRVLARNAAGIGAASNVVNAIPRR
jgi:hypothetical protein